MNTWEKTLLSSDTSIFQAIKIIDDAALQIALVVDDQRRLLGTVTDGDIRRGILAGLTLDKPVDCIMNRQPRTVSPENSRENALAIIHTTTLQQVPVVDDQGRVIGLESVNSLIRRQHHSNYVILMAGGIGSRLHPLTTDRPKPLLNVGGKPVLETIVDGFIEQGFKHFFIALNYKGNMIKEHFGDGSNKGVCIEYLEEKKQLGTAGALSLFPCKTQQPVVVMNGDILTKIDFSRLLRFHHGCQAQATVCVRNCLFQIPYGVLETDSEYVASIQEKPFLRYVTNAGVYVLEPSVLNRIPQNGFINMTDILQGLLAADEKVAAFPIREYWIDIGRIDDYGRANVEFSEVFL